MTSNTDRLPPELRSGYVYDQILRAVADSPSDADRLPDGLAAQGKVIFTPVDPLLQMTSDGRGVHVTKEPVTCTIDPGLEDPTTTGMLVDPVGVTGGVWLPVGRWRVDYRFDDWGTAIPGFQFTVTEEHTEDDPLDLALAAAIPETPTTKFVVNEQVYMDALAARDRAEVAADTAQASASEAVTHADEAALSASVAGEEVSYIRDANMPERLTQIETMAGLEPGEVTDAQTANLITRDDTLTRASLEGITTSASSAGLGPAPMTSVEVQQQGPVYVIELIGDTLWGANASELLFSTDKGETWEPRGTRPPGDAVRLALTPDGGAILLTSDSIYKTHDLNDSPEWELKVTTNGPTQFLAWSLAGDGGDRWLTTEYAAGENFPYSRYARMTHDGGDTWQVVYDSVEIHGQEAADGSHLHGCAYDPWADRWVISEGHSNTGDIAGLYVSEDDGQTWVRAPGVIQDPSPTVIVATDNGLVCATDHPDGGVLGVVRTAVERQEFNRVWAWRPGEIGLNGFGTSGYRDPDTGVVYFSFQTARPTVAPMICGGTATGGGHVWTWPSEFAENDAISRVYPLGDGDMLAVARANGVSYTVRGVVGPPTIQHPSIADRGALLGGYAHEGNSVSVGSASNADGQRNVAVGARSQVTATQDSVAVGYDSHAVSWSTTVVGSESSAESGGTAIGSQSHTTGAFGVAVGYQSSAGNEAVMVGNRNYAPPTSVFVGSGVTMGPGSGAVAVGYSVEMGNRSVGVGYDADASANTSVAVGALARTGAQSVAVGGGALADGVNSVALGFNTEASSPNTVAIGDRDFAVQGPGRALILTSPNGTQWRFTVNDDGELTTTEVV